jgi:hypothetical protein
MDNTTQYGQEDFNLPHDVVTLPSQGRFYRNKKASLKVGYLTAADENILLGQKNPDNIVHTLLRNKIYEPNFDPNQLLDCDVEAILIFLRNSSFGPEYTFTLRDPKTLKDFQQTILLDELNIKPVSIEPGDDGFFDLQLPVSKSNVKCRLLTMSDIKEIQKIQDAYPDGVVAPVVTKRLEMQIVSLNGETDKGRIAQEIMTMPIADSKFIRNSMRDAEPRLDLDRTFTAPSGEKVTSRITFGAEFFRPFF